MKLIGEKNVMELKDAVEILEHANRWRRGAKTEPPNPALLGIAIDTVVAEVKKHITCPPSE